MLTRASKCPTKIMQEVANLVYKHQDFLKENLPLSKGPTDVSKALTASDSWFVWANRQATAIFKLEISGRMATVSEICMSDDSFEAVSSGLRGELRAMKISNLTLRVPPAEAERWTARGFRRGLVFVKLSRAPRESNMMPLLPLINATQKEIPLLSQLLYAAYAKTNSFSDVQSAEDSLRTTMSGARGTYLSNASFASGALTNLVSACLLTSDVPDEARIEQIFTHPLYRARGLATTEIAAAMNQLSASGFTSLTVWNRESNDVVRRLFAKMGFRQERTVLEMSSTI